jgi:hypothetical protein
VGAPGAACRGHHPAATALARQSRAGEPFRANRSRGSSGSGNRAAANSIVSSVEGVFASAPGQFAPGTVAFLTHELQAEATAAGTPTGILNREFAQSKKTCF